MKLKSRQFVPRLPAGDEIVGPPGELEAPKEIEHLPHQRPPHRPRRQQPGPGPAHEPAVVEPSRDPAQKGNHHQPSPDTDSLVHIHLMMMMMIVAIELTFIVHPRAYSIVGRKAGAVSLPLEVNAFFFFKKKKN